LNSSGEVPLAKNDHKIRTDNYFDEKSIEQIANHAWNGNIREMEK
jgi:transcriptional regulator with PAS, ATPase and Fis domain